jgi:hypothetical protein
MQKFDHNIGYWENAILSRKLAQIAENCDHNIDPRYLLGKKMLNDRTKNAENVTKPVFVSFYT